MLEQAVLQCPEALWDDRAYKNPFWHHAYHVLFYTHLYLQPSGQDFSPWAKGRKDYEFLGTLPWPPHDEPEIGEAYSKQEILEYHAFCRLEVEEQLERLDLDAAKSGFPWLPFGKLELQFYNVRHLQHHVGMLCERLRTSAGIGVDWVGKGPA
jgi:hypothetical protein